MTFPSVAATTGSGVHTGSSGTSFNVTIPAVTAGDRLLLFIVFADGLNVATFPAGWSNLSNTTAWFASLNAHAEGRYRDITGSEGWASGGTITITLNSASHWAWRVYRLTAGTFDPATAPYGSSGVAASSSTPNAPNTTPGWGALDTLWFACAANNNGQTFATAIPASYGSNVTDRRDAAQGIGLHTARRSLNAASEDPGAWTLNNTQANVAWTVAIKPDVGFSRIDQVAVAFSPAITTGPVSVDVGLIDRTATASAPTVAISAYSALIVADAPIAYWRLGETSGAFIDRMVGNDGTVSGSLTRGAEGIEPTDKAVSLAGNGWPAIPDSTDMDFTTPFSIEMWVKQTAVLTLDNPLWGKGTGAVPYVFVTGTSQAPAGRVTLAKSDTHNVVQTGALISVDGAWHHIVVTYVVNTEAKIYVDGVDQGGTPTYGNFFTNSTTATIGSKDGAAGQGWRGSIDEVAIYNYALTSTQVTAHFAAVAPTKTITVARISQTAAAFAPIVSPQTILLNRIQQVAVPFAPTASWGKTVSVALINRTAVASAPVISQTLNIVQHVARIDQTAVTFSPLVELSSPSVTLTGVGTLAADGAVQSGASVHLTGVGTFNAATSLSISSVAIDMLGEGFMFATGERIFLEPSHPGGVPPTTSYPVPPESNIVIKVNGVDVTDDVRYRDATFIAQVNGIAGQCQFAVRDLEHTRGFTFGQTITVDIDGVRQWRGFVAQIKRQYSLPVVDTSDPQDTARWFLINGFDINILFQKRVVWNKTKPTQGELSPPSSLRDSKHPDQWIEDAPAKDVVRYVVSHYTDLLADGVNLDGVVIDGTSNPDYAASYAGATTLGDFMRQTNALLSGVFYITPDMRFCYHDVETTTTPYIITDHPTGTYHVGVRDFTVVSDAAEMINDALIWSTAPGVDYVTFGRKTDAASVAAHGRWQYGEFGTSMYKQASVDHRADSLVNGNTATRIGPKHDRIMVEATLFEPLFQLGDVVLVRQEVFDENPGAPFDSGAYTQIELPIRRITMTFPTRHSVKYQLLITQELDAPWSIYESVWPKYAYPKFKIPDIWWPPRWPCPDGSPPPCIPVWPPLCPDGSLPPCIGGCTDAVCGYTDEFNRTVASGWGTSDAGIPWTFIDNGGGDPGSVDGDRGQITNFFPSQSLVFPLIKPTTIKWSAQLTNIDASSSAGYQMWFYAVRPGNDYIKVTFWNDAHGGVALQMGQSGGSTSGNPGFGAEVAHEVELTIGPTSAQVRVWAVSGTRPSSPTVSRGFGPENTGTVDELVVQLFASDDSVLNLDWLDIPDLNRCTSGNRFDSFTRTVAAGGWGTSDTGFGWEPITDPSRLSVTGGVGRYTANSTALQGATAIAGAGDGVPAPWKGPFTMMARWRCSVVGGGASNYGSIGFNFIRSDDFASTVGFEVQTSGNLYGHNQASDDEAFASKGDWVANAWYLTKIEYEPGVATRFKLWLEAATEPSTWYEFDDTGLPPMALATAANFAVQFNSATSKTIELDYIDFDYAGKPCYCQEDPFDDFNRTIANGIGLGTADNGAVWQGAPAHLGVDGSSAKVTGPTGVSLFYTPYVESPIGGTQPWNDPAGFVMTSRFKLSTIHTIGFTYSVLEWGFYRDGTPDDWREHHSFALQIANHGGGGGGLIYFRNSFFATKTDWVAGAWYIVKYELLPGNLERFKLWKETDAEPDWLTSLSDIGEPSLVSDAMTQFILGFGNHNASAPTSTPANDIYVDYIHFDACVQQAVGGGGHACQGFTCETLEHSGGTNFHASCIFGYGSLEVYVNGEILFPYTDYTSTSYQFTLASPILATDTLRICYNAVAATALGDV